MSFVVDASVSLAWCFEDEASPYTETILDRLRETDAIVPAIWPLEIANVLLNAERRQRLSEAQAARFVQVLRSLPITIQEPTSLAALEVLLALGRAQRLSAYDAAYLELAVRQGLPLATRDEALSAAANRVGVPVLV